MPVWFSALPMAISRRSIYIARRLENLVVPFELRTVFSRQRFSQLLMIEGERPAAAIRLEHTDVAAIRAHVVRQVTRGQRAISLNNISVDRMLVRFSEAATIAAASRPEDELR